MDSRVLALDPTLKSGKIKKIHLRNFMCHANFEVNLNKNVNVFVGLNGSGKSAILSALTIGLGSKASSTARSTSLKDLVKQGEVSSTIEITIMNDGIDSYEGESKKPCGGTFFTNNRTIFQKKSTAKRLLLSAQSTPTLVLPHTSSRARRDESSPLLARISTNSLCALTFKSKTQC